MGLTRVLVLVCNGPNLHDAGAAFGSSALLIDSAYRGSVHLAVRWHAHDTVSQSS
ncbi:hypothetical protein AXYL_06727 (plasmid) [Achromobacter xylosoxidans A8]|uniref:Uncharacterized protein n=1 Tax=Achromobacter xylosoxidans (strain A8) TaxID=762376 RepID=E3HY57_ACHXA|nr:hypothetical protein AXYL_06727 [Achromobacter xylosoxidans A8]